jgi:hypothetical protein
MQHVLNNRLNLIFDGGSIKPPYNLFKGEACLLLWSSGTYACDKKIT